MFEGTFTALVTPFRSGGVDETALRKLVDLQVEAGVDGVVPCGSTGESATLSHDEHRGVVEIVVAAAAGRIQVIAGTGSNNTAEAVELTRHAKQAGADGALLISPYYNKPTQEGIVAHYTEVARHTAFPLVVYNIPGRTASNILPGTMLRLADTEHIVAVKEACGDIVQISETIALCGPDFSVVSGDDALALATIAVGGQGVISTTSNVAPRDMVDLVRSAREGDLERARTIHQQLLPLFDVLFCETNPIPVKAAVSMMGLCDDEIRLPMTRITDPNRELLQLVLKEQGIV
ncbi:MAG: 4-hydroxy-tetrahydrodipicolinate synthase [Myxococcales bacterium]|nr:4-hydroxy-tetrahydrodipicolinate synthase [Myxococcales bacterium]